MTDDVYSEPVAPTWRCRVKAPDGTRQYAWVEADTRDEAIIRGSEFGAVMECWQVEGARTC